MLEFPPDCDTPAKRTEYCYRAEELLRLLHNHMAWWARGYYLARDASGRPIKDADEQLIKVEEPFTVEQWDKLPQKIKNRYPYQPRLSWEDWVDFRDNIFEGISGRIAEKLLENRALLRQSTAWTINIEDI